MSITTRIDKFTQAVANDLDIRLSVDDSGSVTATAVEYIVRGEDGSVEWRAGTRRESAERVATANPQQGLTIDSRELTVTIGIGKWESEKAKPPASGDWVYVSTRAAYGVITQIHEGYATVRLPNGNRHTYRTVPLDTLEKIPNTP